MVVGLIAVDASAFEQERVLAEYGSFLNIDISSKGINRINFKARIDKIVGDNSEFTAAVSDNGENLFLTSKVADGSSINMAIQFADGRTLDVRMRVIEKKLPSLIELRFMEDLSSDELRSELDAMIVAMRAGKTGKYYVQDARGKFTLPDNPKIEFRGENTYRYGNLIGASYVVVNKETSKERGAKNIVIDHKQIMNLFPNALASGIDNEILAPREHTRIYVILKGGEDV